jgi:hypothetical protein
MPEDARLRYEERVVAFLDILGFRKKVLQDKASAEVVIRDIDTAISHVIEMMGLEGPKSTSIRGFSDCFSISCAPDDLSLLIRELSYLQLFLCTSGIFVRGSVSAGYHFENDHIIFSEALIKAYDLQAHDKYPRIMIDAEIVQRMTDETCPHYGDRLVEYVILAPDERYCLDYLHVLTLEGYDAFLDELLEQHKLAIVEAVKRNVNDSGVIEKYKWVANYHNTKFSEFFHADDYWPDSWLALRERMLVPDCIFPSFRSGSLGFSKVDGGDSGGAAD